MNVNADDGNQRHGVPETMEAVRDLARAYTRLAIDTIVEVMRNERSPAKAPKMAYATVPPTALAASGVVAPGNGRVVLDQAQPGVHEEAGQDHPTPAPLRWIQKLCLPKAGVMRSNLAGSANRSRT